MQDVSPERVGVRLDATAVKVLAHPLRSRLLSLLRRNGPGTATELAAALSTNTGATSYHLRKLESVGLVADSGEGEGKRRLWRAATDFHSFSLGDFGDDEDTQTALTWLLHRYLQYFADNYAAWIDVAPSWPQRWQDAAGSSDDVVVVTADQLQAMHDEIDAVVAKYRHAGVGQPDALRVSAHRTGFPTDLDQRPES